MFNATSEFFVFLLRCDVHCCVAFFIGICERRSILAWKRKLRVRADVSPLRNGIICRTVVTHYCVGFVPNMTTVLHRAIYKFERYSAFESSLTYKL